MHILTLIWLLILTYLISIKTQQMSDIITDLPDYPYNGKMYSGYLNLKDPLKKYHYVFIEATKEITSSPVVLWLNGGPGCSSMFGFLQENGPAVFKDDDNLLSLNEYSWNKVANMLYIETPGNVGFSYINSYLQTETFIDDDISAKENLEAILDFFNKFPSFKNNDFYISGESYAGIYVPRLSEKIIEYNLNSPFIKQIKFKGFIIGNPKTSNKYDNEQTNSDFAFTHHLYSYEMRKEYLSNCISEIDKNKCDDILSKIEKLKEGINPYDILEVCKNVKKYNNSTSSFYYRYAKWAFTNNINKKKEFLSILDMEDNNLKITPPCSDDKTIKEYLNKNEVKNSLHVNTNIKWDSCNDDIIDNYKQSEEGSLYLYNKLIKYGLRIMIYSGDTDMVVPYNGSQRWINSLKLRIISEHKQWRAFNDMNNIAGYRTIYKGLTFVTIKGSGHYVPQNKPKEAYFMFSKFLKNEDLAE